MVRQRVDDGLVAVDGNRRQGEDGGVDADILQFKNALLFKIAMTEYVENVFKPPNIIFNAFGGQLGRFKMD